MGSAASPNVEVEKVLIGTTSVTNPVFFIEYGGTVYGNSLRFDSSGNLSSAGITGRVVTITVDSSGNIYATSVGIAYNPDLPAISLNFKVTVAG